MSSACLGPAVMASASRSASRYSSEASLKDALLEQDLALQQARPQAVVAVLYRMRQMTHGALLPVALESQIAEVEVQRRVIKARLEGALQFVGRGRLVTLRLRVDGLAQMQHDLGLLGMLHARVARFPLRSPQGRGVPHRPASGRV